MKTKSLIALLSLFFSLSVFSQQRIIVKDSQGKTILNQYIWSINEISFEMDELDYDGNYPTPSKEEGINLGICHNLLWSPYNFGSKFVGDPGMLIGWGDITSNIHSKDKKYYPSEEVPTSIVRSEFDIISKFWKGWRMPKKDEMQSLLTDCVWKADSIVNEGSIIKGWTVSGRDAYSDNHIFIPATGKRNGEDIEDTTDGYYWTGDLDLDNTDMAFCLKPEIIESSLEVKLASLERYYGAALRPVYGEGEITCTVSASADTPTANSANIVISISGSNREIADISSIKLCYYPENDPDLYDSKEFSNSDLKGGKINCELNGLSQETTYKYYVEVELYEETLVTDENTFTTGKPTVTYSPIEIIEQSKRTAKIKVSLGGDFELLTDCRLLLYKGNLTAKPKSWDITTDVTKNGYYELQLVGLDYNATYLLKSTCILNGEEFESDVLEFTTEAEMSTGEGIDMGAPAGVLWSPFNLGADSPYDIGNYYYWGDPDGEAAEIAPYAPIDLTHYIKNSDLMGDSIWNTAHTEGLKGNGICEVLSKELFDFSQTIDLPAGTYILSANACYRYGATLQEEYDSYGKMKTHYAQLYATTPDSTVVDSILNRHEGASKTDFAEGVGSEHLISGYVPNSLNAVKKWFENGRYESSLSFTLKMPGKVKIGIKKESNPTMDDNVVIGSFSLLRTDIQGSTNDIASNKLGGKWCTPTMAQFQELIKNCIVAGSEKSESGIIVTKLVSKINGNELYLPFTGYYVPEADEVINIDGEGIYWTSDRQSYAAGCYWFRPQEQHEQYMASRNTQKLPIRPICYTDFIPTTPDDEEPQDTVVVKEDTLSVDLGLTVKWANRNLGADSPNASGDYFAWGSVHPNVDNIYSKEYYEYYIPGNDTLMHLNAPSISIANSKYDAAHVLWGEDWRMPSRIELDELLSECTWTYQPAEGESLAGFVVTSNNNGNSIFIPAAGRYQGYNLLGFNDDVCIWSSHMDTYNSMSDHTQKREYAYYLTYSGTFGATASTYRYRGMNIRPVRPY